MNREVDHAVAVGKRVLSKDDSAIVISCLDRWMKAGKATSSYELSLYVGISRATLGRWLKGGVRIALDSARLLLQGLAEFGKVDGEARRALDDLTTVLQRPPSSHDRLLASFRMNRVRFRKALAAIDAAGFRIVAVNSEKMPVSDNGVPDNF